MDATMDKETLFTTTSILLNNSDNEISSCDSADESENEDDINLPFRIGNIIHIINCEQNARRDHICLKIDRLCKTCHSEIFENTIRRTFSISVLCITTRETDAEKNGWNFDHNAQYHVQTDEGPERYFRFQTLNGQYRKEKRLVDGTVIGTEGWLDPLGYFRLKDYIADDNGFRILRSKMIYVGKDAPIYDAMKEAERVPTQTGTLVQPSRPPNPFRQSEAANVGPLLNNDINSDYYVSTTTRPRVDIPSVSNSNNEYFNLNRASFDSGVRNLKNYSQLQNTYNKYLQRSNAGAYATTASTAYDNSKTSLPLSRPISRSGSTDFLPFDGSYTTSNGFQYYLKRQYHEEEQDKTGNNIGSFGYIDPFGIRRVIYYKTDPQNGGFLHRKNNRYVGFAATAYDPSPASLHRRRSRSTDK